MYRQILLSACISFFITGVYYGHTEPWPHMRNPQTLTAHAREYPVTKLYTPEDNEKLDIPNDITLTYT